MKSLDYFEKVGALKVIEEVVGRKIKIRSKGKSCPSYYIQSCLRLCLVGDIMGASRQQYVK